MADVPDKNFQLSTAHEKFILSDPIHIKRILKGEIQTYFAPSHKPNIIGNKYTKPTEWIPTDYALRMPQVVWLEIKIALADSRAASESLINSNNPLIPNGGGSDGKMVYRADGGFTDEVQHTDGAHSYCIVWKFDGSWSYEGHEDTNSHLSIIGSTPVDYHFAPNTQTQPNHAMIERDRLIGVFKNVKEKIEKLRKGRTWVETVNWFDGFDSKKVINPARDDSSATPEPNGPNTKGFSYVPYTEGSTVYHFPPYQNMTPDEIEFFPPTTMKSWWDCVAGFLESPSTTFNPNYIGTNFLSIWCGNHYWLGGDPHLEDVAWSSPEVFMSQSNYINMYNRYKNAYPKFFGLATKLFHPDLSWANWTIGPPPAPGLPIDNAKLDPAFGIWNIAHYVSDGHYAGIGFGGSPLLSEQGPYFPATMTEEQKSLGHVSDLDYGHVANWQSFNMSQFNDTSCKGFVDFDNKLYDAVVVQAKKDKLNVEHPGGTSMVTEDYLIKLIAKHYRFDPDTGKDLPYPKE